MKPILPIANLLMVLCMPSMVLALTESQAGEAPPIAAAIHTVRPGDCFDKIARANGCSINDLATANGLSTDAILQLGQQLKLPASSITPVAMDAPSLDQQSTPTNPIADPTHTIQTGDSYSKIAKLYKISVDLLIAANPTLKPKALRPGQKILLPESDERSVQNMPEEPYHMAISADAEVNNDPNPSSAANDTFDDPSSINPTLSNPTARPIATDREMTYGELAALYGTETERLNSLNGLDLLPSAVVVKGADLLVPVGISR